MTRKAVILLLLAMLLSSTPAFCSIYFVKPTGDDTSSGLSWESAKMTIQAATTVAGYKDEIWVAAGAYAGPIDLKNGIALYGGFTGNETERSQRDWEKNTTTITSDEVDYIVKVPPMCDKYTTIDGLTLFNNNVSRSCNDICCYQSSPTIINCTITRITGAANIRGMINTGVYSEGGSPVISDCIITNNTCGINSCNGGWMTVSRCIISNNTGVEGGGIVFRGSYLELSDSTIRDNTAARSGAGIYCTGYLKIYRNVISFNSSKTKYNTNYFCGGGIYCGNIDATQNIVIGNTAASGGGIYCSRGVFVNNVIACNNALSCGGIYCTSGSILISNNTIINNSSVAKGAVYCNKTMSLINNIIAFNSSGITSYDGQPVVIQNNCVYNPDGDNYSGLTPGEGDISRDPQLTASSYGQYHLKPGSPCINTGYYDIVKPEWFDIDGKQRVHSYSVDIGADEFDGALFDFKPTIIHVSPNGSDANDGLIWEKAKHTIQAAIDTVSNQGGEVWVAAGTYYELLSMKPYVYLYGGFTGNELSRNERNWQKNKTVLDGSEKGTVVSFYNCGYKVSNIDGFIIRNGQQVTGEIMANGTVYSAYCSPIISHNVITETLGPVGFLGSSAEVRSNIIQGCGICCIDSNLTIANNTIVGNKGSGLQCRKSSYTVYGTVSDKVYNNIIAFNYNGVSGYLSNPTLANNCIYNPQTGVNYDGVQPGTGDILSDPLLRSLEYGDYHILPGSPCINAGYADPLNQSATDIDDQARIIAGAVDIGADETQPVIRDTKQMPDGIPVELNGVVITAVFPNFFYVETDNRTCGIRIEKNNHNLSRGIRVNVVGVMQTNSNGERYVSASSITQTGSSSVEPLAMNLAALGGGNIDRQEGVFGWELVKNTSSKLERQWKKIGGLSNIGLLVKVYGSILEYEDSSITIDNGSGNVAKCILPQGLSINREWRFVSVTGISSCEKVGDELHRVFLVRDKDSIIPLN